MDYMESVRWDERHMNLLFKVKKARGHRAEKTQAKAELAKFILGGVNDPDPPNELVKRR